jgi:deoxycytidylate deaminase
MIRFKYNNKTFYMKYLSNNEEKQAIEYMMLASKIAQNATCERAKCGSIIVQNNEIIGEGFNSPPQEKEDQRRCACSKDSYFKKVTDKTCCVHAEQRAIMDALRKNSTKIIGSTLYFIRLDKHGLPSRAGRPYCTICSKMALDTGVAEFVLWHEEGVCVYNTEEYNTLSYQYME